MNSPSFQPASVSDFDKQVLSCPPGSFPWDDWQHEAVAAGVSSDLASLGRAVMREAYQHDWCDELKNECGLDNPGRATGMILMLKDQPFLTAQRWNWLLVTDGLRFDPWERRGFDEDSSEWRDMRRRWESELPGKKELQPDEVLLREAVRYLEDFYDLDQLAVVDLALHAVYRSDFDTVLWADFTVIKSERPDRIAHSGVVRLELESGTAGLDAAVFERVEES